MKNLDEKELAGYIDALCPVIYINSFDFNKVDGIIEKINNEAKILEYNNALGIIDFNSKSPLLKCDIVKFLEIGMDELYKRNTYLVLKDIHNIIYDDKVIALLKRISEFIINKEGYNGAIIIVSGVVAIPEELSPYTTLFELLKPDEDGIEKLIRSFISAQKTELKDELLRKLIVAFKGMSEFEIERILRLAYQHHGKIEEKNLELVQKEKQQLIKKSGLLELIDVKDGIEHVGGLKKLKECLERKAKVYKDLSNAKKYGVDIPKGILIVGVPGCGKSLSAKVSAKLFDVPLLRLDLGRILGKYVGESENNMRKALRLAEATSPCVLWIDETEKAFSDVGNQDVTNRVFGQFLTWMQERETDVFVIATANNIDKLPKELLRRGRFDEIFFVKLPTEEERREIFKIQISARGIKLEEQEIKTLAARTNNYSGAEIEYIVRKTLEVCFTEKREKVELNDFVETLKVEQAMFSENDSEIKELMKKIKQYRIKSASGE